MKKLLSSLFVLLLFCVSLAAQERTITGTVKDRADGLPLPGVGIKIKGTNMGTQTGANGEFSIRLNKPNAVLVFSYIGYTPQEVATAGKTTLNVLLGNDATSLGEVVVTALGISRQAKSLGYSTTVVGAEELTKARETNVINSLAGKAAGVRVNSTSGTVGGSSKVVIRGVNSLEGSGVLFVVDGMPVNNTTSAGGTTGNNVDYGNRMGDLSSDDIESMTVLKGAAATALYGSRAKDGAIIITTKKGRKNGSFSVDVNSSVRMENPLVLPDYQNEYAQGSYGKYSLKYTNGWGPKIAGQKEKDFTGEEVTLQAYPDNVKDFFDTGISTINNLAFSGGGDNSDYRLSLSLVNEKGIIPKSELKRYNLAINAGRDFSKKLSSRFTGMYSRIEATGRPSQSSNNSNIITSAIFGLPRVVDIEKLKNNFEDKASGSQIFLSTDKTGNNPYWILNYNKNNNDVDRFNSTYTLTYKPLEWISITNNLGADIYTEKRKSFSRKGTAGIMTGQFTNRDIFSREFNNDLLVTIDQDELVKDFKFKLILGNNINDRQSETNTVDASNLTIDQLYTYTNASSKTPTLAYSKKRTVGVFGDFGVNYKDFLFLNVTGRNDWSSTLPLENRSYFYPSVSGGFIFSELIKENYPWLNYGKLRASWASVGSDLTPYQLDYQYSPVATAFLQYVGAATNVFPIGDIPTAFTGPRILPNVSLKPQRQNSFEVGTEMKILQNRVGLDFTYYNTATKDQLIAMDVAISTGYFAKWTNVGLIRNKGIELGLNLIPVKTKDFTWDVDVNFSKNNQKVEKLSEEIKQYSLASGWSGLQIKAKEGESFGLYGSAWRRDEATGKYIIDAKSGLRLAEADKRLGSIYPDWLMGVNTSFNYKGLSLSGLVDIRQGGVFYSGTVSNLRTSGLAIETVDRPDKFIDEGVMLQDGKYVPNTTPVKSMQDYWANVAKTDNTEGNVFDASYVKLREVRLSYVLPETLFKQNKFIKRAEIGVEGRNLWLIKSHVPHVDPELNFFGAGSVGEGVEFNSIPSTRSFGFNLRVSL